MIFPGTSRGKLPGILRGATTSAGNGGRGGSAPQHRCLARGVEGETPKINSGLSLFFCFPLQGRAHRLRLRVIHSQPVDVGAYRSVPISPCPHPPACPDLPAQVTQNQIQTQCNSSIPSSGCSLGAGIPLISSTIPLGIGEDIKRSCFQFPSSKGFINKRCG